MVDVNTQFGGFLTDLGAAKKTNCDAIGAPWKLTHMLLGDANGADPVPNPAQTQLVRQVYRAQLNQLYVSPTDANVLIAELVLPPNVGGFWIRELALEDEDGVFSAVANCAPSYKPVLAQGSGRNQVVRLHILTSGTANIQLKIDPSIVLATRGWTETLIAGHVAALNLSLAGKQPLDATLTALAGLTIQADRMIYGTGQDAFALTPLTAFMRTLLDDANQAAALTTLGAAPLASPGLTGVPTAPTAALGTNTNQIATMAALQAAIAALLDSSPAALNTLNELATALGNDPNFATTMTNALAAKAPLASPALSGVPTAPTAAANTNTTQLATTAFVVAQVLASLRALPCFHAHPSASQSLSAGVNTRINFGTELFDLANNFSAHTFTAPAAGYYEFDAAVHFTGNGSTADNGGVELWVNGVVSRRIAESFGPRNQISGSSGPLNLAAGDTVQVYAWTDVAATINQFPAMTYFNGRRIS